MPIVNCFITKELDVIAEKRHQLVDSWALKADQSKEHMTVNFINVDCQYGQQYKVIASLLLPSLWSAGSVAKLQLALAESLTEYFCVDVSDVLITTQLISAGHVVENGEVLRWN